ncbi:MAG: nitrile hydratase [Alphaproteobacteria bacterium]
MGDNDKNPREGNAPPHDVGGRPGGPIDTAEHETTFWEQRIDALMTLLGDDKRGLLDTAELRRGIESLGPEAYTDLSYYERWAASLATIVVEKGVVSAAELDARIAEIRARREGKS